MAAPPKPWERPGVNHQNPQPLFENAMSSGPQTVSAGAAVGGIPSAAPSAPPAPPPRPSSSPTLNRPMYGGYGGYSYGGLNSMYGAGSMYGPYGGMGGYGSYGYNRFGMQGDAPGSSFARIAEENSRPAFQSIESIVHAVNSVSMMLDSSFQAVYSSFRAVIGVADNFSRLRTQLMQVFSALAVIRTLRYFVRRFLELLRLRPSGQAEQEWREAMAQALGAVPEGEGGGPKKSAWPIFMFFGIILGGPWLIWKLISSFSNSAEEEGWVRGETDHVVAQALYNFTGQGEEELSFSAGQQLILAPKELQPQVRGWLLASWRGRKGLVPYNYIKVLGKRRGQPKTSLAPASVSDSSPATQHQSAAVLPAASNSAGNAYEQNAGVPDLDSVFASSETSSVLPDTAQPEAATPQSEADMNAADIVEKETGE
ncbi:peroxisomal membrane protein PEX13-like [Babylonia areolata]|uniref:peroxisomal membrane protein PEX13-like n=1 Tax=Babylonia areolata TaxID=304850 RepID=UPI003FD15B99